jgi:hypothetical protein
MIFQRQIAFGNDQQAVTISLAKKNKKTVATWLEHLHTAHCAIREDLKECMQHFGTFSPAEKQQVQWILTSDEIHAWLQTSQSSILIIESQTYPAGVFNPLSFTSSFLAKALRKQECLAICFFAGLRANESMQEDVSGPAAMLASLFAQLMTNVRKKLKDVHIPDMPEQDGNTNTMDSDNEAEAVPRIAKPSTREKKSTEATTQQKEDTDLHASTKITNLKGAIGRLVDELPPRTCVFVVMDSMIHLTGADAENDDAMKFVLDLVESSKLAVKILATGVFSTAVLDNVDYELLFLPDFPDAGGQDINPVFFEGDTLDSIASLKD